MNFRVRCGQQQEKIISEIVIDIPKNPLAELVEMLFPEAKLNLLL